MIRNLLGIMLLTWMAAAVLSDATRGPNDPPLHLLPEVPRAAQVTTAAPAQTLSARSVALVARSAGFRGPGLVLAVAISRAEDGSGRTDLVNQTGDRGLWQINRRYHPEVSDACALTPSCAAQAAFRISQGGVNWTSWTTFQNGSYRAHLAEAEGATNGL